MCKDTTFLPKAQILSIFFAILFDIFCKSGRLITFHSHYLLTCRIHHTSIPAMISQPQTSRLHRYHIGTISVSHRHPVGVRSGLNSALTCDVQRDHLGCRPIQTSPPREMVRRCLRCLHRRMNETRKCWHLHLGDVHSGNSTQLKDDNRMSVVLSSIISGWYPRL